MAWAAPALAVLAFLASFTPTHQETDSAAIETASVATALQEVQGRVGCLDRDTQCPYWAAIGECEANPRYMLVNCQISCHTCPGDTGERDGKIYQNLERALFDREHAARSSGLTGQRSKMQELSASPRIMSVDDFLTAEQCEYLKKFALPNLSRAKTIDRKTGQYQLDKVRTNSQMYIHNDDILNDPVISDVVHRLHTLARIPLGHAEPLQVGRYMTGEFYHPHFDSEPSQDVRRAATVIIYLEAPQEGGHTIFPKRKKCDSDNFADCCSQLDELVVGQGGGLWIAGKKGQALLFYSHDLDGKNNPLSMHASCPVLTGEKWIVQQWFRVEPYKNSPHFEHAGGDSLGLQAGHELHA
eukprot:TRINITY_DN24174_c0_g2_i1.p1 TRINITY_DN24174_c0_g2~~TRINITY_DN24174_c0_g2_i1.p1  ORF type:complete len:363 (-),score=57.55 TRINITY_DN24174_c0_g2_i1:14-1081(-)